MNRECGYLGGIFCNPRRCYLIEEVIGKANTEGFSDPELTRPNGPYWIRSAWSEELAETLTKADSAGCLRYDELFNLTSDITQDKDRNNQLL